MFDDTVFADTLTHLRMGTMTSIELAVANAIRHDDPDWAASATKRATFLEWTVTQEALAEEWRQRDERAARFAMAFLALHARKGSGLSTDLSIFRADRSSFTSAQEIGHAYLSRKQFLITVKRARRADQRTLAADFRLGREFAPRAIAVPRQNLSHAEVLCR